MNVNNNIPHSSPDHWPCPGCSEYVELTPSSLLRIHFDPATRARCLGTGFSIVRPSYPQYVKRWGWRRGNELEQRTCPTFVPPYARGLTYPPGALQELVLEAYPRADRFGFAGSVVGECRGLTFTTAVRRWYYVTAGGCVGEGYTSRADASEAFIEQMQGV